MRSQIQQVSELCMVVDKEKTGCVKIQDFMRIAQMSGLKVDNIRLMKFTNERENRVEYSKLAKELLGT